VPYCQKYTPTDCFCDSDFAHWAVESIKLDSFRVDLNALS